VSRLDFRELLVTLTATLVLISAIDLGHEVSLGDGATPRSPGEGFGRDSHVQSTSERMQTEQGFAFPESWSSGPGDREVQFDSHVEIPDQDGGDDDLDGSTFEINVSYDPPGCPGGTCWIRFEVVTDIPNLVFFRWDMNDDGVWDTTWHIERYVDWYHTDGFNLTVCAGAWDGFSTEVLKTTVFHQTIRVDEYLSSANAGWLFKSEGDYAVGELGYWRNAEDYPGLYIGLWRMPDGLLMGSCTPVGVTEMAWQWCTLSPSVQLLNGGEYLVGLHKSIEGSPFWTAVHRDSIYIGQVEYEGYYHSWDAGFPGQFGGMDILPKCNLRWSLGTMVPLTYYACTHCIYDPIPPNIADARATPNPQEVHRFVNISAIISDAVEVSVASVNISMPSGTTNATMTLDVPSGRYFHTMRYDQLGDATFTIWASDSSDNWNSSTSSFSIVDRTKPIILHNPINANYVGMDTNITATVNDNFLLQEVMLNYSDSGFISHNVTMVAVDQDKYSADIQTPSVARIIRYFIWAVDSSGNAAMTSIHSILYRMFAPVAPLNLTAVPEGYGALRLNWEAPTSNIDGSPLTNLAGYNIYRMFVSDGTRIMQNTEGLVQVAAFTDDKGLEDDKTYFYVVTAVNSWGNESAESNEASGTTLARTAVFGGILFVLTIVILAIAMVVLFLILRNKRRRNGESEGNTNSEVSMREGREPPKGN